MRKPGGSLMRLRLSRIASAFFPVCGTGGMLRSVPETRNCFSFSMVVSSAEAAPAAVRAATIAARTIVRAVPMVFSSSLGRMPPSPEPRPGAAKGALVMLIYRPFGRAQLLGIDRSHAPDRIGPEAGRKALAIRGHCTIVGL